MSTHIVLKGESLCQDPQDRQRMCDCIIFVAGSSVIIGIVELKSKTAHSSEVADKLTNSSEIALEILRKSLIATSEEKGENTTL